MSDMFDSVEGYWMKWDWATRTVYSAECKIDFRDFDEIMERMATYGLLNGIIYPLA